MFPIIKSHVTLTNSPIAPLINARNFTHCLRLDLSLLNPDLMLILATLEFFPPMRKTFHL